MEQLINPATLARVKDLPLIAKTVAEGFLHGMQSSVLRGSGIEFSQYRSYEPGDSPNKIDWKLFGRCDRYYIRQAEQESETIIWLVLDCSGSMTDQNIEKGWDKLQYAKHLAATIAYIAGQQGDSVGLLALSTQGIAFVPPGIGLKQWQRLATELIKLKSGDTFPNAHLLKNYIAQLQRPSLTFVLSDFYQHNQEISEFLKQIHGKQNEVVALQLQSAQELTFDYKGLTRFKDLETGEALLLDAKSAKDQYFSALIAYQQNLKIQLNQLGISLHSFNIADPMDIILANYLKARTRMVG